jgi:hypothetical protein
MQIAARNIAAERSSSPKLRGHVGQLSLGPAVLEIRNTEFS